MPGPIQNLMNKPTISRMRRNHALEHATIHILSQLRPSSTFVGRSDAKGFYLLGDVPTGVLAQAVDQALARLRAGNRRLAIHSNCGTSYLTAGVLAAAASFLTLQGGDTDNGWRSKLQRLPIAVFATILALLIAQPLGLQVQRHITTASAPGTLKLRSIRRISRGRPTIHRVFTSD